MDQKKAASQYKAIIQCLLLLCVSVILYLVIIFKFSEWIFVNPQALYLLFVHYLVFWALLLFFAITAGFRLMALANVLKQRGLIKMNTVFILLGYVLCLMVPILLPFYLWIFWILANKILEKA